MKVLGIEVQPTEVTKEPVLDVPTIVMTEPSDTGRPARKAARKSRSAKTRPAAEATATASAKRTSRRAAKAVAAAPKQRRDGSVGRATFEAVEALVMTGMPKGVAVKQVARKTGRSTGTVSTTYYRVGRSQGSTRRRSAPSAPVSTTTRRAARRPVNRSTTTEDAVTRLVTNLLVIVEALTAAVKQQDAQLRDVRTRIDDARAATR